eukprot:CCRYP_004745-RA/>CCRYP_004745-RA protein AED:0.51 eAED:0.72 QI:0/0/0/1/0/0/2/0/115
MTALNHLKTKVQTDVQRHRQSSNNSHQDMLKHERLQVAIKPHNHGVSAAERAIKLSRTTSSVDYVPPTATGAPAMGHHDRAGHHNTQSPPYLPHRPLQIRLPPITTTDITGTPTH